jgi:hypothetical protein
MKTLPLSGFLLSLMSASVLAVGYIDVLPGSHNVLITRVVYEVDGEIVVQNAPVSGVAVNRDGAVYLKSITVNDGGTLRELSSHNSLGASTSNMALNSSTKGVGVFDNGVITRTSNIAAFSEALAATTQDTDLLNYCFYDFVAGMPNVGVADYDLLFHRSFEPTDFVLVSERWGNTYFTLTALDAEGEVITGANILRFGYPTGDGGYTQYDWNSGYASSSYVTDQAFAFTAASVSKFFEGTSVTPQNVFGFRVDNDGQADVKFLGLSDNSFTDNKPIPEPSTTLLAVMAALACALHRRR